MVIKTVNPLNKNISKSNCALNKTFNGRPNISMKINFVAQSSVSSFSSKIGKHKKTNEQISPYLNGANVQVLSQMREKKFVQKKSIDFSSSFAQVYNIYRANSDELKCMKENNKKHKHNILPLTLSNKPNTQQTVSDMNDSDYHNRVDNNRRYKRKRHPTKSCCRPYLETKKYEFYNGDLLPCPLPKTDKSNLLENKKNNFKMPKMKRKRKGSDNIRSSEVWTLLRDMNRFQYISSPPLSEDSFETIKRKGKFIRNLNETGFIERCTTEEFSYISSYDLKSKSQSTFSQPSSFDRITIVDKKDEFKVKDLIKYSVANVRNPKKKVNKAKYDIENKTNKERQKLFKITKASESGNIENGANKYLDNNVTRMFKKSVSKESLNEHSSNYNNEAIVIDSYVQLINDLKSKNEISKKPTHLNQRDTYLDPIRFYNSNDRLSEASGKSSKAGLQRFATMKYCSKPKNKADETAEVTVNKQRVSFSKQIEVQKQIPRETFSHKLTQIEIRRRLASLKFPIVILDKDEISSTFHVFNYDPPQFSGLNQQIWPYMAEWLPDLNNSATLKNCTFFGINKNKNKIDTRLPNNDLDKISDNNCLSTSIANVIPNVLSKNKDSKINCQLNVGLNTYTVKSENRKMLGQFKNRMWDLICNKSQKNLVNETVVESNSSNQVLVNDTKMLNVVKPNIISKVHSETNSEKNVNKKSSENSVVFKKSQPAFKYPWAKAKWASDFIDNILKKIKKGIYYTHHSEFAKENLINDTEIPKVVSEYETMTNELIPKSMYKTNIPGFDDSCNRTPLHLEVKMVTRTQISIHHCSTNVMLQFDVTNPAVSESLLSSSLSSLLPVVPSRHKCMLYKYKTTIPNAILPAELCSILPKLIPQVINEVNKKNFRVADIIGALSPVNTLTQDLQGSAPDPKYFIKGSFSINSILEVGGKIKNANFLSFNWYRRNISSLLPEIVIKPAAFLKLPMYKHVTMELIKFDSNQNDDKMILKKQLSNKCMALVPYVSPNELTPKQPTSLFKVSLNMKNFQQYISGFINFMNGVSQWKIKLTNNNNYQTIYHLRQTFETIPNSMTIPINYLLYKSIAPIESNNHIKTTMLKNEQTNLQIIKKSIKRTFVMTYKKCKSMTNMSRESSCTSLNKIKNLDDFFHALGCFKSLSSVLQGYSGKTVLLYIFEMKSWTKEITQAQALLILLLANKRETINLKRFRPMLLQGIAVNRITTAVELDMEIEVIEKENLCVSQNEGISFLSVSNDKNLLDELCWIAKTTASDYQKPFNDSSRKLLKSLLGKRKRLNPSYLRVMARYVGLGLLKQRGTNCDK